MPAVNQVESAKEPESRSGHVFVTTTYHSGLDELASILRFAISTPGGAKIEQWALPWGTTKVLRRHWEWLAYCAGDQYPNDPRGLVASKQVVLSVDGNDFFSYFNRAAKTMAGAALEGKFVINTVFQPDILIAWLDMASNYTTEQARGILGFADYRSAMNIRLGLLKSGKAKLAQPKPLSPIATSGYGE